MSAVLLSVATFFSTYFGGLFSIKNKDRLHKIMGFTAGVLIGVVFFDIFPEIINLIKEKNFSVTGAMVALVLGFLIFHILEKTILIHHSHEDEYAEHSHAGQRDTASTANITATAFTADRNKHPHVGIASGLALAGHSFMDGVGIGLGFQVSPAVGLLVAIAVIAHDFTDGMNTVTLVLSHGNSTPRARAFLLLDALTPVLGVASTLLFHLPESFLVLYLGFFAGFLLYIGASDILPEAHSKHSSFGTIGLTIAGLILIFIVTRFA
jgi:ZIP family zinc transporter